MSTHIYTTYAECKYGIKWLNALRLSSDGLKICFSYLM